MWQRQTCTECKVVSPQTDTMYTLIGRKHSWRVSVRLTPDGAKILDWRCPKCWRAHKAKLDEAMDASRERER